MKITYNPYTGSALVVCLAVAVVGCVPANRSISSLNAQTAAYDREISAERGQTRNLLQSSQSLRSELSRLKSEVSILKSEDPIGHAAEIRRKEREMEKIRRHLETAL